MTERQPQAWQGEAFRLLAENVLGYALFIVDPLGHVLQWTAGAERLLGFSEQESVGRHFSLAFTPEDVSAGVPEQQIRQATQDGRAEDERWQRRKDGTLFWASGILIPLHDPQGRLSGFSKFLRDVTGRKRADDEAQKRHRQLEFVADNAPVLLAQVGADRRLEFVNKPYAERFGLHPRDVVGRHVRDVLGAEGYALIEQYVDAALRGERVEYEADVPHAGIGTQTMRVAYEPKRDEGGRVVGYVAAMLNVTDLDRAQEELAASRRRLQALFDNTQDAILLADDQARYVDANPAACELLGYDREELLRRGVFDVTSAPNGEAGRAAWAAFVRDGTQSGEYAVRRKDGSTAVVEFRAVANVQPGLHLSVLRDVTERKRTEEALRQSEERFARFMQHLPGLAWIKDAQRRYVYANDPAARAFGKPPAELYGRTDEEVFPPATAAQFRENDREALAAGSGVRVIETLRHDDGVLHHSLVSKFPIPGTEGQAPLVGGVAIDVTEEMRTRTVLEESEERFRATFDQAAVGIAHVGLDGRWLRVNRKLCDVLAYRPDELMGLTFQDVTHPDDLEADLALVRRLLAGEIETYAMQKRYVRRDGSLVWANLTVSLVHTHQGRPKYFISVVEDVTEKKQVQDALRESEQRLRTLSDNLPDGAVYQTTGTPEGGRRFAFISAGVERVFGVSAAEAMADAAALYGLVHEDDRARLAAAEEAALRDNGPFDLEFRSYTRGRGVLWVHCRSAPRQLASGVTVWEGIVMDVTERRQKAERLRLLAEAAEILLDADDPDAMLRGLFAKIGPHLGLDVFFELVAEDAGGGLRLATCVGIPDDAARAIARLELSIWSAVALERRPRVVGRVQGSDDPRAQLIRSFGVRAYACYPLLSGEQLLGTLSFASRSHDEFDPAEVEFLRTICHHVTVAYERVRLIRRLREQDRRKDDFLATLAHELRNPLAPIRNGLQILRLAGADRAMADRAMGMMERQLGQMVRLIDDLLDVSRITRGKLQLRPERVELASVVHSAVESSRPLLESSAHRLEVTLPPGPVFLDADPTRLAQVFANLLTNAAKYTNRGGHVRLRAERQGGEVVVSVKDNGIGISAEHLPRLFEMFSQVDTALDRSQGGLGIGLSLVKGLVEMHGGSVGARSDGPGKGSEFVVRLPASGTSVPDAAHPAEGATPRRARRILVADDNRDAADSLAVMLRLGGHEVHSVHDGQEAVEAAGWFRPDVALLDLGMPKMNGFQAARRIREQSWGRSVVLVAITGWGQEEDKRLSAEAGFDEHLTKPVAAEDLERVLASLPAR